jgi:hypothetical protein
MLSTLKITRSVGDIFRFNPFIVVSIPVFSRIDACSLSVVTLLFIIDGNKNNVPRYKPINSVNIIQNIILKRLFIGNILC